MPSQHSATTSNADMQARKPTEDAVVDWTEQMIADLKQMGSLNDKMVENALRLTKRHLFVPNAEPEEAYWARHAVPVKSTAKETLSTMSAPQLQAEMLEQSAVEPGMNVLEIGSGGVNAAMLEILVGEEGGVTSLDIDEDIVNHARTCLRAAGHDSVQVEQGDAEFGFSENAPYDRIIVTCGSWDIPKSWKEQLKPDGKIIVPLRVRGITRSLELAQIDDALVSQSVKVCGFVKIQGEGSFNAHRVPFKDSDIAASYDESRPQNIADKFQYRVISPGAIKQADVSLEKGESFESLQLWLATRHSGFCRVASTQESFAHLVQEGIRIIDLAITSGSEVAAVCLLKGEGGEAVLGAVGLTPDSESVTVECQQLINEWNDKARSAVDPIYTISHHQKNNTTVSNLFTIRKRHCTVSIAWPNATAN